MHHTPCNSLSNSLNKQRCRQPGLALRGHKEVVRAASIYLLASLRPPLHWTALFHSVRIHRVSSMSIVNVYVKIVWIYIPTPNKLTIQHTNKLINQSCIPLMLPLMLQIRSPRSAGHGPFQVHPASARREGHPAIRWRIHQSRLHLHHRHRT